MVDTTVLVYAVGADHRLRGPCRAIVSAISDGGLAATTTAEVIQEFTHVRARRRDRADAVRVARGYSELLAPLTVIDDVDLAAGLDLFASTAALGAFDCVLAAAAIRHQAALVSADRAFGLVPGLTHLDPGDPDAVERLIHGT